MRLLAVGDQEIGVGVDGDAVRQMELARAVPGVPHDAFSLPSALKRWTRALR
jgi:hypothetical protein